jgi:hypothetical protein
MMTDKAPMHRDDRINEALDLLERVRKLGEQRWTTKMTDIEVVQTALIVLLLEKSPSRHA